MSHQQFFGMKNDTSQGAVMQRLGAFLTSTGKTTWKSKKNAVEKNISQIKQHYAQTVSDFGT